MRRYDEVVACWAVGGGFDYLLQIVTRDIDAYQRLIDATARRPHRARPLLHLCRHEAGEGWRAAAVRGAAGNGVRPACRARPGQKESSPPWLSRGNLPRPARDTRRASRRRGRHDRHSPFDAHRPRGQTAVPDFAYVGGKWRAAASGETFVVTDPATGDYIGEVAQLSADEARAAVDTAHGAFPDWARRLPQERARLLRRWFERDRRQSRGPRPHHDAGAGQAALGSPRRDRLRAPPSSSSTPRKPSARTSRASPPICPTPRWSSGASPSASPHWSRRGTSPPPC